MTRRMPDVSLCYGRCTVDASVTAGAITRRIRDRARRLNATSNAAAPAATTRSTSNSRLPSPPSGLTCSQFSIQFTSSPLPYRQTGDRHYQCIRGERSVATPELYGKFVRHSIGLLLTAFPGFPVCWVRFSISREARNEIRSQPTCRQPKRPGRNTAWSNSPRSNTSAWATSTANRIYQCVGVNEGGGRT